MLPGEYVEFESDTLRGYEKEVVIAPYERQNKIP